MRGLNGLPELDHKKTQVAMDSVFEQYRLFKSTTFQRREVKTTASYSERFHGPTNVTSDSTADTAIYNVFQPEYRERFCEAVDAAVGMLATRHQELIRCRYLSKDKFTDSEVYNTRLDPPVSRDTYSKLRNEAFQALAYSFDTLELIKIENLLK
ncbi:ArpU family phage packaging/lysis transcriptional regulator [Paenibacillus sp. GbtcB18]|uniref:ArpU family phage packaging/lysis transcriptional regulator n=1 Tax=Paenibacillus sp. GbtcB18 TaxID=2824763 RepID=UPI001C305F40|nr:ArpU family phage packaging/lysis transcriptional regulator [Paenibacillus sp. GbtcB18]